MKLSREKIQRMIEGNRGGSSGSGGGSSIAGGASQAWVNQNYVSIEFFRKVFKIWAAGATSSDPDVEIMPNDIASTVKNIQAQAGLWTESFLSALGNGGGGGTGGASTLDQLDDVVITSPTNGQALIYNATTQMWVNGTIQSGTDMATVWAALAAATNEQINASHLSGVLADYVTTTSLQTILGDYLTQTAADQRYITIAYFDRLFRAYNGSTLVSHNDITTTIDNIKAMFGFWTDMYLSALGRNSVATGLGIDNLTDVTINSPTDGQVLQYNATSSKWENATIQTVVALSGLTDVLLTNPSANQFLMYDVGNGKWVNYDLKTINGQPLYGSGDISVGGGASGNYLPLAGGTMTGAIYFSGMGSMGGYNGSGVTRIGRFDHGNGLVIQSGGGNIEFINQAWSWAPLVITPDRTIFGKGDTSQYVGGCYAASLMEESDKGVYKAFSAGTPSCGFQFGVDENNQPTIGTYGTTSPYTIRLSGNVRVDFGLEVWNAGSAGYIDFHYYNYAGDFSARIIEEPRSYLRFFQTGALIDEKLGIGITSVPSYKLHVAGDIYATGAITALSDARKKDITGEAVVSVEQIAHAPAVQFLWKDKERRKDGQQVGTLAQYWQQVLPEVVMDKGGELSMQYGVAALVSSITIARKVVDHEQRIRQLEKENEELKKQLKVA